MAGHTGISGRRGGRWARTRERLLQFWYELVRVDLEALLPRPAVDEQHKRLQLRDRGHLCARVRLKLVTAGMDCKDIACAREPVNGRHRARGHHAWHTVIGNINITLMY